MLKYVPQNEAIENVWAMVEKARSAGIKIIVGTVPPVNADLSNQGPRFANYDFNADINNFNTALRSVGVPVADYHAALTGPDGLPIPGALRDGVHPSPDGYNRMAAVIGKMIQ